MMAYTMQHEDMLQEENGSSTRCDSRTSLLCSAAAFASSKLICLPALFLLECVADVLVVDMSATYICVADTVVTEMTCAGLRKGGQRLCLCPLLWGWRLPLSSPLGTRHPPSCAQRSPGENLVSLQ